MEEERVITGAQLVLTQKLWASQFQSFLLHSCTLTDWEMSRMCEKASHATSLDKMDKYGLDDK